MWVFHRCPHPYENPVRIPYRCLRSRLVARPVERRPSRASHEWRRPDPPVAASLRHRRSGRHNRCTGGVFLVSRFDHTAILAQQSHFPAIHHACSQCLRDRAPDGHQEVGAAAECPRHRHHRLRGDDRGVSRDGGLDQRAHRPDGRPVRGQARRFSPSMRLSLPETNWSVYAVFGCWGEDSASRDARRGRHAEGVSTTAAGEDRSRPVGPSAVISAPRWIRTTVASVDHHRPPRTLAGHKEATQGHVLWSSRVPPRALGMLSGWRRDGRPGSW